MSLTAPGIKGVVTDFIGVTPSATVAFQAVSAPAFILHRSAIISFHPASNVWRPILTMGFTLERGTIIHEGKFAEKKHCANKRQLV